MASRLQLLDDQTPLMLRKVEVVFGVLRAEVKQSELAQTELQLVHMLTGHKVLCCNLIGHSDRQGRHAHLPPTSLYSPSEVCLPTFSALPSRLNSGVEPGFFRRW